MTEHQYLKRVCEEEEAVYLFGRKIEKGKEFIKKANEEIERKKKTHSIGLSNQKKIIEKLEREKNKECVTYELISPAKITLIIAVLLFVFLCFQSGVHYINVIKNIVLTPLDAAKGTILPIACISVVIPLLFLIIGLVEDERWFYIVAGVVFVLTALIGFFISWGYYYLFLKVFKASVKTATITFTFIGSILIIISSYIWYWNENESIEDKNKKILNTEKEFVSKISKEKRIYDDLYLSNYREIQKILNTISTIKQDIVKDEKAFTRHQEILRNLYKMNYIHSDYRRFECVELFLHYFDLGLCTSIKGEHGAYSIYRKENLTGKTMDKIDCVSAKIGELSSTINASNDFIRQKLIEMEARIESLEYRR